MTTSSWPSSHPEYLHPIALSDGPDAIDNLMANTRNNPLEDLAMHIPMICDRYELRDDVAPGAGRFRGGIGVVKAQRILTDGIITHESERHTNVPWGIFGGKPGAVGKCDVYNVNGGGVREMPSKFHGLAVKANDVMAYYSPCGGGYGSPLERDPRKVLDDVLDGFCSAQDAADVYGVVLDLDAEIVDLSATKERRARLESL
jgi:N-methylhydantoinase B